MALPNSGIIIPRQSVVGSEGLFTKMFDPPKDSPPTPDRVDILNLPPGVRANPVPEVMQAAGLLAPVAAHTRSFDLMHNETIVMWDGKELMFFLFKDPDLLGGFDVPSFPAPTLRVPRGAVFHGVTKGHGPPPHTIHWHGIEPTPINDGVGHCSMELGDYTYQWQPNFIGSYFFHCHRNTVQHFEFGLYGFMIFEPPDAYFASLNPDFTLNAIPIGACRDGKFRTAANLKGTPLVGLQDNFNALNAPDPLGQFLTDPHAHTVPYDVEALWVCDDRDSNWSDLAPDARATYPEFGSIPGVNDNFFGNAGGGINPGDFFAFNDFRPDYFFVTGVNVPGPSGTAIPTGIVVDPHFNSGKSGMQVDVNAQVNQTILIRCLDAAYCPINVTLPVDAVIIEWDGRALGVPPLNQYTHAYLVKAGTPIKFSVARRFSALVRSSVPVSSFATVEFLNPRGLDVVYTARIPVNITA